MILNKKLENYWLILLSLPLWECGLKFHDFVPDLLASVVAPFVGVWIEICCFYFSGDPVFRRSLCGSVDWNLFKDTDRLQSKVAPFVGVWIEIMSLIEVFPTPDSVDWNFLNPSLNAFTSVAPFVGVWIEIYSSFRCWSLS